MTKLKLTNHTELRKRSSIDCSHPILTDQSSKHSCDINNIVASYHRTGMLPHFPQKTPFYADISEIPDILTATDIVRDAHQRFLSLPSNIRKLMDNDPRNLPSFFSDPSNLELLQKYGLKPSLPKSDPKVAPEPKKSSEARLDPLNPVSKHKVDNE